MNKKQIAKIVQEMNKTLSPQRRQAIDDMLSGRIADDLPMQQTHFGGEVSYDSDLKIVELNGAFSKEDLIRISASMV